MGGWPPRCCSDPGQAFSAHAGRNLLALGLASPETAIDIIKHPKRAAFIIRSSSDHTEIMANDYNG
jgi:hypothetical protein